MLARSCDTLKKDAIFAVSFVNESAMFLASSEFAIMDFPMLMNVDPVWYAISRLMPRFLIAESANASISLRILPNALFTTLSTSARSDASPIASFPNLMSEAVERAIPNSFVIPPRLPIMDFIPLLNPSVLSFVLILMDPSYCAIVLTSS